ncbi:MAG: hypothetical protein AAFQ82_24755, partial [Myxococcota bacterium]
ERHLALADAILRCDSLPSAIVWQEMQKDDGTELTSTMTADKTYNAVLDPVRERTGKDYQFRYLMEHWTRSGGQPGGNIHLGFAWDPEVLTPISDPIALGMDSPALHETRKPLAMAFRHRNTGEPLVLVDVHNTSLRYTRSPIAQSNPGEDPRGALRVEQNRTINAFLDTLDEAGIAYQVSGDFNDTEFSESIQTYAQAGRSIVEPSNEHEQADYNHRGVAQNLSHLVTSKADENRVTTMASFDEQARGVPMGQLGGRRSSDHGVLWSKMTMRSPSKPVDDIAGILTRAQQRADAFANRSTERAKDDLRLLAGLSYTVEQDAWVSLARTALGETPSRLVEIAGLLEDRALEALLGSLSVAEVRAVRDAAAEQGLAPLVRLAEPFT